jgi:hypothetical protein
MMSLVIAAATLAAQPYPPLQAEVSDFGRGIQRTMRRLAESTPEHRNTVRILFYGQSITEQGWWKSVVADLKVRFPHANIVAENRSLGGFSSQFLVKTAETDLYPFEPDLLVFHVYGAHDKYADIVRRVRERTAAEILLQTDHVTKPSDFQEETDAAKLPPAGKHWDAFMNHNWLPSVARKYGAELCDQRSLWKQYLTANKLEPKALLSDAVHLNARGEFLMAECVKAYLRRDAKFDPPAADSRVKTFVVGKDVDWKDGKLTLTFRGRRVEAVCKPGDAPAATILIDGKKPGEFPGNYALTRAIAKPGGKWPVVAGFGPGNKPVVEDWFMDLTRADSDGKLFTFTLRGSVTGPDGNGRSDTKFISNSGRVAIDPEHWNVAYALALAQVKPVPEKMTVTWKVVASSDDEFSAPKNSDPTVETAVTLARGLPNGDHVLEIRGGPESPISALRAYDPSGR